jgi:sulfatase maturation enzyme AslB (radical SAM superfamily)
MEPFIYFQTTYDCNLKCAHCFQDSGPHRKDTTISLENFKKVIENLPEEKITLQLTGGEIFKNEKSFWNYLNIIKNINEARKNTIDINVQTNGFWGNREDYEIKEILHALNRFDVKYLDITSNDKYHLNAGLKLDIPRKIINLNLKNKIIKEDNLRGVYDDYNIFPVGRGKNISKYFYNNREDCKRVIDQKDFTIDPYGNVYMCGFNLYKLPGNIINDPLEDVIKKAKKDPILQKLNSEGIIEVAKYKGMSSENIEKLVSGHGKCGLCAKLNNLF